MRNFIFICLLLVSFPKLAQTQGGAVEPYEIVSPDEHALFKAFAAKDCDYVLRLKELFERHDLERSDTYVRMLMEGFCVDKDPAKARAVLSEIIHKGPLSGYGSFKVNAYAYMGVVLYNEGGVSEGFRDAMNFFHTASLMAVVEAVDPEKAQRAYAKDINQRREIWSDYHNKPAKDLVLSFSDYYMGAGNIPTPLKLFVDHYVERMQNGCSDIVLTANEIFQNTFSGAVEHLRIENESLRAMLAYSWLQYGERELQCPEAKFVRALWDMDETKAELRRQDRYTRRFTPQRRIFSLVDENYIPAMQYVLEQYKQRDEGKPFALEIIRILDHFIEVDISVDMNEYHYFYALLTKDERVFTENFKKRDFPEPFLKSWWSMSARHWWESGEHNAK